MKHFYVATSKIAGFGLMAGEDIKTEELVFQVKGQLKFKVNKNKKDAMAHPNWWGVKPNQWIDPEKPYKFLNHSCEPNLGIKGKVSLVALRPIKEGEELTVDYSTFEGDPRWEMPCTCGKKLCRRMIRSIQHLPASYVNAYYPYLSTGFVSSYKHLVAKRKLR